MGIMSDKLDTSVSPSADGKVVIELQSPIIKTGGEDEPRHVFKSSYVNPNFIPESSVEFNRHKYDISTSSKDTNCDVEQNEDRGDTENVLSNCLTALEGFVTAVYNKYKKWIIKSTITLLFILYNIYLGFSIFLTWDKTPTWCEGVKFLTLITIFVYCTLFYFLVFKRWLLRPFKRQIRPVTKLVLQVTRKRYSSRVIWIAVWSAILLFLVIDTAENRHRLVSTTGLIVLLLIGYIFSAKRAKIVWRHVLWGCLLQFLFGLVILRWSVGRDIFECTGDKIKRFLKFTDEGSAFVYGYLVTGKMKNDVPDQFPVFAFKVLSVVFFFSFCISLLYYYGVMQWVVMKVGWFLQVTVGTTACESMNSAGNIFLGMTEAPLMIKPFLPLMTKSELHAVMTGGFATIAGGVLAAYINFGVNANHLLSASVMSAPAALAYSKLFYPEVEESRTHANDIKMERGPERNGIEAASNGAYNAISMIASIIANLIAFISFIHFVDFIFSWFGSLLGWDFISFEWLIGKIFTPLALIMGVEWEDCYLVARLVGIKTVVNEFVAYKELGDMKHQNLLSPRSESIATYALCGFSNIGSIGIQLGCLSAMAPERKSDLAAVAIRAMIAGSMACFMTACIAGSLLEEPPRSVFSHIIHSTLPPENITTAFNITS
ncbi:putative transporter YutK [Tachypleus tridentatus]|uniref:putative transporter YutK n=1 Tax=Tachypleus tridentatus TaxID=6853 RepID=UPI003FD55A53